MTRLSLLLLIFISLILLFWLVKKHAVIKKLTNDLLNEKETFYGVLDHANDMIFLYEIDKNDHPGSFIFANRRAERLLGYGDAFPALTLRDISDPVNSDKITAYHQGNRFHAGETWEGFLFANDGKSILVEMGISTFVLHRNKVGLGIARDITIRKSAEREISETKEQLELFWNHSADALFLINREGDIEKVNKAFEEMFGWKEEEVLGKKPTESVVPPNRRNEAYEIMDKLHQNETIPYFETERTCKNGEALTILASYAPIKDENGYVIGGVCFYKDVTKQKEAESLLQSIKDQFEGFAEYGKRMPEQLRNLVKRTFDRLRDLHKR